MVVILLYLVQTVCSQIIRSNIDRYDNVSCSDELPIAASIFNQGDLKCLTPQDIFKNTKFANVNEIEWLEFRYHHFEKYIFTNRQWKREDFYTYQFKGFIEVHPITGSLRMVKYLHHAYIFRTFGDDPRNPAKHVTRAPTKNKPSNPPFTGVTGEPPVNSSTPSLPSPSSKVSTYSTTRTIGVPTSSAYPITRTTGVLTSSTYPATRTTEIPTSSTHPTTQTTAAPTSSARPTTRTIAVITSSTDPTTRTTGVPTSSARPIGVTTSGPIISSKTPTKTLTNSSWITSRSTNSGTEFSTISQKTKAPIKPAKPRLEIIIPICVAVVMLLSTLIACCVIRNNGRRLSVIGHIYHDNTELDTIIETETETTV